MKKIIILTTLFFGLFLSISTSFAGCIVSYSDGWNISKDDLPECITVKLYDQCLFMDFIITNKCDNDVILISDNDRIIPFGDSQLDVNKLHLINYNDNEYKLQAGIKVDIFKKNAIINNNLNDNSKDKNTFNYFYLLTLILLIPILYIFISKVYKK